MTSVAVLGAGFQGVCAALALAGRGQSVDLFDRNAECITEAGLHNEGKIHIGFVYANDPTRQTAERMARGALAFDRLLLGWLDCTIDDLGLSGPHHYAVHRDSLLPVEDILAYFGHVQRVAREIGTQDHSSYLGQSAESIGFERCEVEPMFDPQLIRASIRTDERSVDVARVARLLRRRVADDPRITFSPSTEVEGASRDGQDITLRMVRDGQVEQRRYRQVVNCLWDGQYAIDEQMDSRPPHTRIYRQKFGAYLTLRDPLDLIAANFVLGSFGDVVPFGARRTYVSWYPVALANISTATSPPRWRRRLPPPEDGEMVQRMLEGLGALMPPLRAVTPDNIAELTLYGGTIVAQGATDIDDPHSQLHRRTAVGVRSDNGYHSVDTGKYTLAPIFARDVADRVCLERGC